MSRLGVSNRPVVVGALLGLVMAAPPVFAQTDIRLTVPTIKDARSRYQANPPSGNLTLFPKVEGTGLEEAKGYRITVTSAKDDLGNSLLPESPDAPKWADKPGGLELWTKLKSPARDASAVTLTGSLEVWFPSRDPASEVKVDNFYAKAGKPIVSKGLKDAQVEVTVIPRDKVNEGSVVLQGPTPGMNRIRSVRVVRADGTLMDVGSRGSQYDSETTMVEIAHSEPIPKDAGLVLTLMTEKAVVVIPLEMSIPLP
jgi:hypothetical protein